MLTLLQKIPPHASEVAKYVCVSQYYYPRSADVKEGELSPYILVESPLPLKGKSLKNKTYISSCPFLSPALPSCFYHILSLKAQIFKNKHSFLTFKRLSIVHFFCSLEIAYIKFPGQLLDVSLHGPFSLQCPFYFQEKILRVQNKPLPLTSSTQAAAHSPSAPAGPSLR